MNLKLLSLTLFLMVCRCAFAQQSYNTLTVAQMQGDLNVLQAVWTNLHPGIYLYNTPEKI